MSANKSGSLSAILAADIFTMLILLTAAFGLGLAINQCRDRSLPLVYQPKELRIERAVAQITASDKSQAPPTEHMTISTMVQVDQLRQFLREKRGIVFDARPEIFHRLGHIPGAKSLPREDFENAYQTYKRQLEADRDQPIIVYCSSSSCEDSTLVQKALQKLGYTNVAVFPGGWAEWEEQDLPAESNQ